MFDDILQRAGARDAIARLVDDESKKKEQRKDRERARLRKLRDELSRELALGKEALARAVKAADAEVATARDQLHAALRKKVAAERELSAFEHSVTRRRNRAEYEIARRPIVALAELRNQIADARKGLGGGDLSLDSRTAPDRARILRLRRLREIERELEEIERTGDSIAAEPATRSLQESIRAVAQS